MTESGIECVSVLNKLIMKFMFCLPACLPKAICPSAYDNSEHISQAQNPLKVIYHSHYNVDEPAYSNMSERIILFITILTL